MLRFGLCCTFLEQPIKFRATTARYVASLDRTRRREHLRNVALDNAGALRAAVDWCAAHGLGAFRVTSGLLPVSTHPEHGYALDDIDADGAVRSALKAAGARARTLGVRLSFHPDPYVVLSSAEERVAASAVVELEHHGTMAALVGAEQVTLHAGGAAGGKPAALDRLRRGLERLSEPARRVLALENDDRVWTPADLLPTCRREHLPLVYDVHHHRCHPDGLSVTQATDAAAETWRGRLPWVHVSSPASGWHGPGSPRAHADYIDPADFPACWFGRDLVIDVEAKAKEQAVLRLMAWCAREAARPERHRRRA